MCILILDDDKKQREIVKVLENSGLGQMNFGCLGYVKCPNNENWKNELIDLIKKLN